MAVINSSHIRSIDNILRMPGVRTLILTSFVLMTIIILADIFYRFTGEYYSAQQQLTYYANWPAEREKLQYELARLKKISAEAGNRFYSKANDNAYYAKILEKAKMENLFINRWKTGKVTISANRVIVPLSIKARGKPYAVLSFLRFLENSGNPLNVREIDIRNADDQNNIDLTMSLEVIFKNG